MNSEGRKKHPERAASLAVNYSASATLRAALTSLISATAMPSLKVSYYTRRVARPRDDNSKRQLRVHQALSRWRGGLLGIQRHGLTLSAKGGNSDPRGQRRQTFMGSSMTTLAKTDASALVGATESLPPSSKFGVVTPRMNDLY